MASRRIVIDDFTGGRNTLDAAYNVKKNQHITGSGNVWAENRLLTKRRGITGQTVSVPGGTFRTRQLLLTQLAGSSLGRLLIAGGYDFSANDIVGLAYTDNGTSFRAAGYTTGTVSGGGSPNQTITGTGTAWLANAAVGDYLHVTNGDFNGTILERITAIASDTELTIANAQLVVAGSSYVIIHALVQTRPITMFLFDVGGTQNVIVNDGSRTPFRWTGSNTALVSAMPLCRHAVVHKGHVFIIGQDSTDVEWCALRDVTTWPANNSQAVTNIGNPTRGLAVYGDHLVIFCRSKMFRLLGDTFDPANPTYVLEEITVPDNFLFTYPRTAVMHQGVLKFLAQDGWFAYDGGPTIKKISQDIQTDVDAFYRPGVSEQTFAESAVSFVYKDRMWCSVADNNNTPANQINAQYVQDERGAWWRWGGNINDVFSDYAAVRFGSTGSLLLLAANSVVFNPGASDAVGYLATMDTGAAIPTGAINGIAISKDFVFPEEVEFQNVIVLMEKQSAGNLNVDFSIDQAAYITNTADMSSGIGTLIEKRIPIARIGKSIRIRLANNTADQTFAVAAVFIEYEPGESWRI